MCDLKRRNSFYPTVVKLCVESEQTDFIRPKLHERLHGGTGGAVKRLGQVEHFHENKNIYYKKVICHPCESDTLSSMLARGKIKLTQVSASLIFFRIQFYSQ